MHLLQKRIMYLNSDDALTDSNDTRGDLNIPVPQQLPDPGATDLVFKMYIQDAVIVNDNVNINDSNAQFSITVRARTSHGDVRQVFNRTYLFPHVQTNEIDFLEQWNSVFGPNQLISVADTVAADPTIPNNVKARYSTFESFRLEWTAAAYENDRWFNGYRPAIERTAAEQATLPPFQPLGDRMLCIVRDVRIKGTGTDPARGREVAWMANHLEVYVEAENPAGGKLLGLQQDQSGPASVITLTPFWAAQYPAPVDYDDDLPAIGSFDGNREDPGTDVQRKELDPWAPYNSPNDMSGPMRNAASGTDEPYPKYEDARNAAAMPFEMLMDDFTQLHINTDLPVQNSEIRPTEGLSQTRITALVPVGVPHGSTIYYQDKDGINAAYERNQSTLARLHIWLTDKYGKAYMPASPWSFSFALEIWQDDFKRMLDILLASQSLHESAVKLAKLGLVGASFQALEG